MCGLIFVDAKFG